MRNKTKGQPVESFAAAIRAAREKKEWTRAELARQAGCGFQAVAKIEDGDRAPSLDLAARLAAALGLRTRLAEYAEKIPE